MLFLVTSVKLICEIALLSLLGRWLLAAWIGRLTPQADNSNPFLWVLDTLCRPFVVGVGWMTRRFVPKQHHALVAFLLLMLVWGGMTLIKIALCLNAGALQCR
jgi:hypothetical protein